MPAIYKELQVIVMSFFFKLEVLNFFSFFIFPCKRGCFVFGVLGCFCVCFVFLWDVVFCFVLLFWGFWGGGCFGLVLFK